MKRIKDAALVHSYGYDENISHLPNTRGRLVLLASLELLRRDKVEKLVITGGRITKNNPPLAEVMADHAYHILPCISDRIIAIPTARNTREEITHFKRIVEKEGWNKLEVIGSEVHLPRIQRDVERAFSREECKEIEIVSAEEVLTSLISTRRYQQIINELQGSPEELSLRRQEVVLNLIDAVPYVGPFLLDFFAHIVTNKYETQEDILRQLRK